MKKVNNTLFIGIFLILLYTYLNNPGSISNTFSNIFSYFSVFIYGGFIAFLLNPILIKLEKNNKITRKYSILIIYTTLIVLISLFFSSLIPRLATNITELIDNYPKYIKIVEKFIDGYKDSIPFFKDFNFIDELLLLQQKTLIFLQQEFSFLIGQVLGVTAIIFNLIFSLIFSIFFLSYKEYFNKLTVEFLNLIFPKEKANKIIDLAGRTERVFLGYISGKSLDSIIIGSIAMIGLRILGIHYIILLGIFITLFNFIPYIGPFFGILLGGTIALFTYPTHTIYVIIFLALLQQFDAWFLEPKILGNSLNLSMFWTIAAVTFGGSVFGALGIIIAIPGFALIKELYLLKIDKSKIE
jgi:predicted PurR-regulated permease PerM